MTIVSTIEELREIYSGTSEASLVKVTQRLTRDTG